MFFKYFSSWEIWYDPAYDKPKSRYIVCGQANLDKSDFYQRNFLQYLHALGSCFKLNAYGDIGPGMEVFGFISQSKRQKQMLPLQIC